MGKNNHESRGIQYEIIHPMMSNNADENVPSLLAIPVFFQTLIWARNESQLGDIYAHVQGLHQYVLSTTER